MIILISKRRWLLAGLLAAAVAAGVWTTVDFDARAIRRQSDRLLAALNQSAGPSNPLAAAWRVQRLLDFFAQQPVIQPGEPWPDLPGRAELSAFASQVFLAAPTLHVKVLDRDFSWTKPRTEGSLRLTVEVQAEVGNEPTRLIRAYATTWIKENRRWVIARVQYLDSIRAPPASE